MSPLFRDSVSATRAGLITPQSVQEYTVGGSATVIQSDRWTHSIVAGFDGSRLSNLADYHTPLPSAGAPDLGNAGGNANLGSLRVSSVGKLGNPDKLATTLRGVVEENVRDFRSEPETTSAGRNAPLMSSVIRRWTTAGVAQANFGWKDAGYLTTGLRVERNEALGDANVGTPMVGVAAVRDVGQATVKLRSAYGRGIRAATTPIRETTWFDPRREAQLVDLAPSSSPESSRHGSLSWQDLRSAGHALRPARVRAHSARRLRERY
jgi:iron complex outermembrane receptor protein